MLFFLIFSLFCSTAYAVFIGPPSTSAGIIDRQIEREIDVQTLPTDKPAPLLIEEGEEPEYTLKTGSSIYIETIDFEGNTLFSSEELCELVSPYLQTPLSMQDIREITTLVQQKYAKEGYIFVRVFPPEQTIQNRTLKIRIIEATLGQIEVIGNCQYKTEFIKSYFTPLCCEPINVHSIIAQLLRLNEFPDLAVAGIYKKGEQPGTTDLTLRVSDQIPVHLNINTNNYGSSLTTTNRSGIRMDIGNCFFQGAQLSLAGVVGWPTNDLRFTSATYSIPVNALGTTIQATYLYSHFHVNAFNALDLKGTSQIGSLELNHAAYRTRDLKIDFYANFDYKYIQNFALDIVTANDQIRDFYSGAYFDWFDIAKGRNWGDIWVTAGIPNFLGGMKSVDSQCSRIGGGNRFFIVNLDYKRLQGITKKFYLLLNFSGQLTWYKLPIPQQIYIGGFDTVRGYPLAVGLGDNGYFANLESRILFDFMKWKDLFQLVFFVDHGGTLLNGGGEAQAHHVFLTSAGAGFRFTGKWLDVSFDAGFPITSNFKKETVIYYFRAIAHAF